MLAHEPAGFSDAQRRLVRANAPHHLVAHPATAAIGGVGFEKAQDISLGCRIKARVLAEVLFEPAHHTPPRGARQQGGRVRQVTAGAFLLPGRVREAGHQIVAATVAACLAARRQRKRQQADCADCRQHTDTA